MSSGTLEVMLIGGQKIKSRDSFNQGSTPTWNTTFKFDVEYCPTDADDKHKITFRVMDEDLITADDELGGFEINAKRIISDGMMSGQTAWCLDTYNIICRRNGNKYGEIRVGVRFLSKNQS
ncbi:hypothetical protein AQUCO_02700379v1 [Aquilegia coerulea]|uniref:C2 domain-containing protein n=1 Tax=Aquilegia coerulea TaxID=218851 RepID=A0A2G5D6M6_AQUCA|nr:hypothetical protein AQUCO_02700379v1 [Aquilegia coerulea]